MSFNSMCDYEIDYGQPDKEVDLDTVCIQWFGDTVRCRHHCPRNGIDVICAPKLHIGEGHTIVQEEPLTIVASLACDACGLHGFVTDGKWVPA